MLRGTRVLQGHEAQKYVSTIDTLRRSLLRLGYEEVVVPSIWEAQTFIDKSGHDAGIYRFDDKKGRDICLVPEVTAVIQSLWNNGWSKTKKHPYKVFYVQRCYRYERPQMGRYREFTQVGAEILASNPEDYKDESKSDLRTCLNVLGVDYKFVDSVKRGTSYYVEDGFEAESESLGAQKQLAGGGRYPEGVGWGIGVDRIILLEENHE